MLPLENELFSAVEIEINHNCNRRCSYCPNSILKRKNTGEIDPGIFAKLLAELSLLNFSGRISYDFYNEPMLHSDFAGIVRQTRYALPRASLELYTNGTLLTLPRFNALLEAGISEFIVTQHEADIDHSFSRVFAALDPGQRGRVKYRGYQELTLTNRGGTLRHLGAEGLPLAPCHIPRSIVTVTVSGNVLPCFEDFHENLVMGNLADQTLIEIWMSAAYVRFRSDLALGLRHLHDPCKACNRREALFPQVPLEHKDLTRCIS